MKILALLLIGMFLVSPLYADPTAGATKTFSVPTNYQVRIDYTTGTNPIYVGYADKGAATSSAVWFIMKITWDENNNPTLIQIANNAVWDNRTTTTYN